MKKNFKPIILSAAAALAFGGIAVGTTFALFTSKADTSIRVGSGKIEVISAASNLTTYSTKDDVSGDRVDENGAHYSSEATVVNGTFTNGGSASLLDSTVTLTNITPGDRVTFNVNFEDNSNVNYKYRYTYRLVSEDQTLAKGLVTKANFGQEETYEGLLEFVSIWYNVSVNPLPSEGLSFDIELPVNKGNVYQDKEAQFLFTLETVQGNAYTDNADEKVLCGIEDISAEAVAVENEDVELEAVNEEQSISVKTTIPAAAAEVNAGDKVELFVTDMDMDSNSAGSAKFSFDITLKVNDVVTSEFSKEITVEIYVGEDLQIEEVRHNNVVIPSSDYTYNPSTGIITFTTNTFSPFSVTFSHPITGTGESIIDSGDDNE